MLEPELALAADFEGSFKREVIGVEFSEVLPEELEKILTLFVGSICLSGSGIRVGFAARWISFAKQVFTDLIADLVQLSVGLIAKLILFDTSLSVPTFVFLVDVVINVRACLLDKTQLGHVNHHVHWKSYIPIVSFPLVVR